MKKLLFSLLIGLVVFTGTAQAQCQAYFSINQDSSYLYMNDYSYNLDSSIINVTSWDWTISGMGVAFSYTGQNPVESLNNLPDGPYLLCLNITTATACTSSYCETIITDSPYDSCISWVDMNVYPVTVVSGNDGAIDITVYDGTAPFTYSWNTGATTEDLYGVPSGTYSCTISDSDCFPYSITATILEPYDSNNVYVDTLNAPIIDTCFTFVPDSFYISGITTNGNIVSVTWVFCGAGQTTSLTIDYPYSYYGSQAVVISIGCNNAKMTTTYISYIFIHESVGIDEELNHLNVYPNPASEYFNLPEGLKINNLRILGLNGSLLKEIQNPEKEISLRDIPVGMYIIVCESDSGTMNGKITVIK